MYISESINTIQNKKRENWHLTTLHLPRLKAIRIVIPVRSGKDLHLATIDANLAKIRAFFNKVVIQNASVIVEIRYEPGSVTKEAANVIRNAVACGAEFGRLRDELKSPARGENGGEAGLPKAQDVVLVFSECQEDFPEISGADQDDPGPGVPSSSSNPGSARRGGGNGTVQDSTPGTKSRSIWHLHIPHAMLLECTVLLTWRTAAYTGNLNLYY